jgi:hypothetical protein
MSPRDLPYDQLTCEEIIFALGEEIGDPELFVGRKKEMARLRKWAEGSKRRISRSMGILARRKKGKTALLQRFYNHSTTQPREEISHESALFFLDNPTVQR